MASYLKIAVEELQDMLGTLDVRQRLEKLIVILSREIELLELGHKIQSQVQTELNKNQREYYLRQQLKAIQKELGEGDPRSSEIEEIEKKIEAAKMSQEARKVRRQGIGAAQDDSAGIGGAYRRAHLSGLAGGLPWGVSTEDNLDIKNARGTMLDEDHYDLEKVKSASSNFSPCAS